MFNVPEGRVIVDYQKIIDMGCNGLIEVCQAHLAKIGELKTKEDFEQYNFYKGTILALEGLIAFANSYAAEAEGMSKECTDEKRQQELLEIAEICRKVPAKSPQIPAKPSVKLSSPSGSRVFAFLSN